MRLAYHVMSSPVGLLFLARTERGLRYLEFMDRKSLKRMIASHEAENAGATWEPSLLDLKPYVDQLDQYFCGDRSEFTLPLDPVGSDFQREVWGALRGIPYGETRSYGALARAIGQPKSSRAVGLANHQNPIAIVVPCHRVIGANGKLVGFGGGLPRKKWLLDHEARFAQPVGRTGDLFTVMATRPGRGKPQPRAGDHEPRKNAPAIARSPGRPRTAARSGAKSARVAARAPARKRRG
ncbi:MAG TPA: methylated-DNA--[protein]-cysteine S-methyltransferase [Candidatus Udaeobacter sp.]|jgi:methylated-DNA-[protein]-cysteine S-methyltransferase|nr:methylated-DNA--[protein]-cysteine S-methyltransferase [Candidatus Udaeobacter sp.]